MMHQRFQGQAVNDDPALTSAVEQFEHALATVETVSDFAQ